MRHLNIEQHNPVFVVNRQMGKSKYFVTHATLQMAMVYCLLGI